MASFLPLLAALAAAAAPAAPPANAQLVIAPPVPPPSEAPPEPPVPVSPEALLTLGTEAGRMTVPVSIDGRGPWPFIIDTGAERTVISRELAGVLGLRTGRRLRVIAMTGAVGVDSVIVPRLSASTIARAAIEAPVLDARDLGAAGLLGIDALQDHVISIDFAADRMTLKPSRRRARTRTPAAADEVVVTARSLFGQLIVTEAFWRTQRISVVIDTGSPVTVGNRALLAAITRRPKLVGPVEMVSATGATLRATAFAVDRLDIGGIGFRDVTVAFTDAPPFERFGLGAKPALLLGMDALRLFRQVRIDFANREIRFALPARAL